METVRGFLQNPRKSRCPRPFPFRRRSARGAAGLDHMLRCSASCRGMPGAEISRKPSGFLWPVDHSRGRVGACAAGVEREVLPQIFVSLAQNPPLGMWAFHPTLVGEPLRCGAFDGRRRSREAPIYEWRPWNSSGPTHERAFLLHPDRLLSRGATDGCCRDYLLSSIHCDAHPGNRLRLAIGPRPATLPGLSSRACCRDRCRSRTLGILWLGRAPRVCCWRTHHPLTFAAVPLADGGCHAAFYPGDAP